MHYYRVTPPRAESGNHFTKTDELSESEFGACVGDAPHDGTLRIGEPLLSKGAEGMRTHLADVTAEQLPPGVVAVWRLNEGTGWAEYWIVHRAGS
jgi:hypothetical protein